MLYTDWLVNRSGDIRTASFKISWNPRGACHMFIDNKIGGKKAPMANWLVVWNMFYFSIYPLVNQHSNGKSPLLMGKSTISMAIFHCYVSSPEGIGNVIIPTDFHSIIFQRGRSTTKQQITVWKIAIFNGHTIGLDQPLTGSRVNSVLSSGNLT